MNNTSDNPSKSRVLIIDDDVLLTTALEHEFQARGFETAVYHTTEEGVPNIDTFKPDIILLDIMVPGKNGIDVIKDLCGRDPKVCEKIIMMTSLEDASYLAEAMKYHVTSYITKATTTTEAIVTLVEGKLKK